MPVSHMTRVECVKIHDVNVVVLGRAKTDEASIVPVKQQEIEVLCLEMPSQHMMNVVNSEDVPVRAACLQRRWPNL